MVIIMKKIKKIIKKTIVFIISWIIFATLCYGLIKLGFILKPFTDTGKILAHIASQIVAFLSTIIITIQSE
jgi:hypothetical protein